MDLGPLRHFRGLGSRFLADHRQFRRAIVQRKEHADFRERLLWDAVPRPWFAYGMYHAARQAAALGMDRIAAIEFGVAGGNGLLVLEELAKEIEPLHGVAIEVWGFDLGRGLPGALDVRDCPYLWAPGDYVMDEAALRPRLTTARLVLGDVKDTVTAQHDMAPVGFVSFDLDYYSSTAAAFALFDAPPDRMLPRVFCYFDDIIGGNEALFCEFVGELLAIAEYNDAHADRKIARIYGLAHKRKVPADWNDMMFVHHAFSHPRYATYLGFEHETPRAPLRP
jgi:hypothetical protein